MEALEPAFDYVSPRIRLTTQIGRFVLTHENTRIRTFNDHQFNHVEFTDGETTYAFQCSPLGVERLCELQFPILTMPYIDKGTFEWLVEQGLKDLERN